MAKKKELPDDPATSYAHDVAEGKIPSCRWVRLACERHLKLLKTAPAKGYAWDERAARKAIGFFRFLRHVKAEWRGCEFVLEPWQAFIVGSIFGWKRADGARLVRTAYIEVPRKNGKTELAAGLGLYLLIGDGEPGAEVYCAATKRDQAKLVHDAAAEMVRLSPALRNRLKIYKNNINDPTTFSKFEPLGADKDTMDGLNSHGVIVDELHAHKDRGIWDVLVTSTGSRRQPLIMAITTAGLGGGPTVCREQHDYAERVLTGQIEDDSFFSYVATIDEGDDWTDEAAWRKANPGLGTIKKLEVVREDFRKAIETPANQNTFRRYHLNEWVQQETRYIDLRRWDASAGLLKAEDLQGRICYGGLDLANKIDIASFVLLFPWEDGRYRVLPFFWVPEDAIIERSRRDRVPYDAWARQGFIRTTTGEAIDYLRIREDIVALSRRYRFWRIGYDPWTAFQMAQELELEGFEMIEVRPGMRTMTEPTKELARLITEKRLVHGGNPVLRWMADNLVVRHGPTDLVMPDKEKSREKIDGIVALITALYLAMRFENTDTGDLAKGVHFL